MSSRDASPSARLRWDEKANLQRSTHDGSANQYGLEAQERRLAMGKSSSRGASKAGDVPDARFCRLRRHARPARLGRGSDSSGNWDEPQHAANEQGSSRVKGSKALGE